MPGRSLRTRGSGSLLGEMAIRKSLLFGKVACVSYGQKEISRADQWLGIYRGFFKKDLEIWMQCIFFFLLSNPLCQTAALCWQGRVEDCEEIHPWSDFWIHVLIFCCFCNIFNSVASSTGSVQMVRRGLCRGREKWALPRTSCVHGGGSMWCLQPQLQSTPST